MRQSLRLRLLALVLALVLFWYSVNPAPYTAPRRVSKPRLPDEKKRTPGPRASAASTAPQLYSLPRLEMAESLTPTDEDPDDFDWPEFIDG